MYSTILFSENFKYELSISDTNQIFLECPSVNGYSHIEAQMMEKSHIKLSDNNQFIYLFSQAAFSGNLNFNKKIIKIMFLYKVSIVDYHDNFYDIIQNETFGLKFSCPGFLEGVNANLQDCNSVYKINFDSLSYLISDDEGNLDIIIKSNKSLSYDTLISSVLSISHPLIFIRGFFRQISSFRILNELDQDFCDLFIDYNFESSFIMDDWFVNNLRINFDSIDDYLRYIKRFHSFYKNHQNIIQSFFNPYQSEFAHQRLIDNINIIEYLHFNFSPKQHNVNLNHDKLEIGLKSLYSDIDVATIEDHFSNLDIEIPPKYIKEYIKKFDKIHLSTTLTYLDLFSQRIRNADKIREIDTQRYLESIDKQWILGEFSEFDPDGNIYEQIAETRNRYVHNVESRKKYLYISTASLNIINHNLKIVIISYLELQINNYK